VNEERLEAYQENTRSFLDRIDKERAIEILEWTETFEPDGGQHGILAAIFNNRFCNVSGKLYCGYHLAILI
jgi:hypothetical protein